MSIYDDRIHVLQEKMKADDVMAYLIPNSDPHLSEEPCDRFTFPKYYYCAFRGSDGTVLVTQYGYYLFTDGRYWAEAQQELQGTECILMKAGAEGVPSLSEFIKQNRLYPLGIDGSLFSVDQVRSFYLDKFHPIKSVNYDSLIEVLPLMPKAKIWRVDPLYLSQSRKQRIESVVKDAKAHNAVSALYTDLDDVAYLLGYRGRDIACTPVFYAYLFIDGEGFQHLFIDSDKLPRDFNEEKVVVHPYGDIYGFLKAREEAVAVDYTTANALIVNSLRHPVNVPSKATIDKAVKGPTEVKYLRKIHAEDGLQVLKLMKYIRDNAEAGLDEKKVAYFIDRTRKEAKDCFDISFTTIAAVDSNAAMMHYAPTGDQNSPISKANQLVLVDSGGQYFGGTTDITRTFIVADEPRADVIHDYTLTLKSQIAMSKAIFIKGCSGHSLDFAAREVMWREGLDYKCGTGHGVSYMGPVHEGPIGFRYYHRPGVIDDALLTPGHVITIEPGVYKDGVYGIRLENELLVVPAFQNEQGTFYKFETITYCPYDRKAIDVTMLNDEELQWLNDYLALVYQTLSPLCENQLDLHDYLLELCQPFTR